MQKLKVKRLTETAKLPIRGHKDDAGLDVFADEDMVVTPFGAQVVKTGIAIEIPQGYYGRLKGRSGLSSKTSLRVIEGTIDSNYRGEIGIMCDVRPLCDEYELSNYTISKGDKIAQLIIQPVPQFEIEDVEELSDSDRGASGFGSTGK